MWLDGCTLGAGRVHTQGAQVRHTSVLLHGPQEHHTYRSRLHTAPHCRAWAQDVGGRVFFGGEATIAKWPATMHGAFISGLREAAKIRDAFGPRGRRCALGLVILRMPCAIFSLEIGS